MKKSIDNWQIATAYKLLDEQFERLFSLRLKSILNRKIEVCFSSDYDYWDLGLVTPLTEPEMERLYAYADADENDRADHKPYQNFVNNLGATLAIKLISKIFPVSVQSAVTIPDNLYLFTTFEPFDRTHEKMLQKHGESGDWDE